ncbi:sugar-phosphatase [Enterobacterales bacterium CwR94]|nr:sugar-phosphatase [Enterobacterales bacterium CwR94]
MAVKLIAVDMDGTFLDDKKQYNKARFLAQYAEMKAQGIRFVVASGNQYWQLISFFPEIRDEIAFVAENGAYVVNQGEEVFCGAFTDEQALMVMDELLPLSDVTTVVCGKNSAYISDQADESVVAIMSRHYHRLEPVADLRQVRDTLFKFALNLPEDDSARLRGALGHRLDGIIKPVSSGFGFVDLIIPGLHKANGIQRLQQQWQIGDEEVVAFGDSGNDEEMLRKAGFSFAMENARPEIKAVAKYAAGHHNQQSVLDVIDDVLAGRGLFAG